MKKRNILQLQSGKALTRKENPTRLIESQLNMDGSTLRDSYKSHRPKRFDISESHTRRVAGKSRKIVRL